MCVSKRSWYQAFGNVTAESTHRKRRELSLEQLERRELLAGVVDGPTAIQPRDGGSIAASVPLVAAELDPSGIYPRGQRMPLSFYNVGSVAAQQWEWEAIQDAGFTMAGPYFGDMREWAGFTRVIDEATQRGLKFAYPLAANGVDFVGANPTTELDAAAVRAEVESIIVNPVWNETVAWWNVQPDELRSWSPIEMEYLKLVTETVRQVELDHELTPRPIWMYEPSNRAEANLIVTGEYVDVLSKAAYMWPRDDSRAWVRWSIEEAVRASAALDHHPTPIAVLNIPSNSDSTPYTDVDIQASVRHDAFLSLVAGAKGLMIYRMGFETEMKHPFFDAYASVATDLTGELGLDKVFLFGAPRGDLNIDVLAGPGSVTVTHGNNDPADDIVYDSVSYFDVDYDGGRYLIAVNSAEAVVNTRISGLARSPFSVDDLFDAPKTKPSIVGDGHFEALFEPLEVKAWRIQSVEDRLLATHLFSTTEPGTVTGTDGVTIDFDDVDILQLSVYAQGKGNPLGHRYQLFFDGSDVGLTTAQEDIDAFTVLPNGDMLVSTAGNFRVPGDDGAGRAIAGTGADILRFTPTSLGEKTSGQWSLDFDGSDVGLDDVKAGENIDALEVLSDGRLVISTAGATLVPGLPIKGGVGGEDLLVFRPKSLGANTAGRWAIYFDGRDVGFQEDIGGLFIADEATINPPLFLSAKSSFTLPNGVKGNEEDVFAFKPTLLGPTTTGAFAYGLALDGSRFGLSPFQIDDFYSFGAKRVFNVVEFGATPNRPGDDDSAALQLALDYAHQFGGTASVWDDVMQTRPAIEYLPAPPDWKSSAPRATSPDSTRLHPWVPRTKQDVFFDLEAHLGLIAAETKDQFASETARDFAFAQLTIGMRSPRPAPG